MSTFDETLSQNPLLGDWSKFEHAFPPFEEIKPVHYEPALKYSMDQHLNDIKAIAESKDIPTFENTVVALDSAGDLYERVCNTFENLCSSLGTPEYQEIELKMASPMAEHYNKVATFPGLFAKIDAIYQQRVSLSPLQKRLVERYHLDFVRAGAKFSPEIQVKYGEITKELAQLTTQFTQNVVADEAEVYLELKSVEDKEGLPNDLISAARQAAIDRNLSNEEDEQQLCIITLSRSLVEPFLTYSSRRELREKAWRLWTSRGELMTGARNNYPLIQRILSLRQAKANYHGYTNFAEYALADTMAGKPDKVLELLQEVWNKGKGSIAKERNELEGYLQSQQHSIDTIEPWDWRYYAEKVRIANYALDATELKPYFTLSNMLSSLFHVANRLFGLSFVERNDLPKYHPSIKIYEVYQSDNNDENHAEKKELIGIFISDNFARSYKHSGAWMSNYRNQKYHQNTRLIPIIVNNNNFNPPTTHQTECFVSVDDTTTLFHEFGHGLHGLLSNVLYSRLSGTNVLRDFVELPSQLMEHWALETQQLLTFAKHIDPPHVSIPLELIERLKKARKFNQGFQTIEYTASALVDIHLHMKTHSLPSEDEDDEKKEAIDLPAFEQSILQELGMPKGVVMRHRLPHFQHLFSGDSYASAYYVYLWAEVLDADGYEAFLETGDIFHPEVAARVRKYIYAAGNSQDPVELYRLFRGRDPRIEPMLRKKGLIE